MNVNHNSLPVEIGAVEIRLEETEALPARVRLSAREAEETAAEETELGELKYLAVRVEGEERQEDSSTDPLANAAIATGELEDRIVMGKVITSPSQAARLAGALAGALAGGSVAVAGFVAGTAGEGEAEAVELVAVAGAALGLVAGAEAALVAARAGVGEGAVVGAGGGYVAGIAVAGAALAGAALAFCYAELRAEAV